MEKTQWKRKIDSMGRVMLPIRLREKYEIKSGQEVDFYVHAENGRTYICIEGPPIVEGDVARAKEILRKNGYAIDDDD